MKLRERSGWIALIVLIVAAVLMLARFLVLERAHRPLQMLTPAPSVSQTVPNEDRLNINTATAEELAALPGIGAVKAEAILAYRAANGPFRYPEDLIQVKGIGEGTLKALLDRITTGGE